MIPILSPELEEFRQHVQRWTLDRLMPRANEIDRSGEFPRDLFEELAGLGYLGIMYDEEFGGLGADNRNVMFTILIEELSRASMSFAGMICMHGSTATFGLAEWGSQDLKARYLAPALKGEMIGAFAITESNAGSDAASLRTRADKVDGGYVINGAKIFTSNAPYADFVTVAATSDAAKGVKGIGLYFVDTKTPGFSVSRTIEKFLIHGSATAETTYEDVFVPDECRLGSESGFLNAYKALTVDRIYTGALAMGNARAAYDAALEYSKVREQFGRPIGKFQAIQFKLVNMLATIEQMRLYLYQAAQMADRGDPITKEAAMAKLLTSEGGNAVCRDAMSIFGGYGLTLDFPVERYLRDSFFPMVGGGTCDIMRTIVAKQIGI